MTIEPREDTESHPPTPTRSARILSVQSHVAFGYVGGKAAVFPLQCMGYNVDVVNTVNFSNHTGYEHFGGTRTNPEELTRVFDYMQKSGLLLPSRLLTGYIPNAESLNSVHELVKKLRASNPDLVYLLDPVMGDAGRLYVAQNCISAYRQVLPLATIITPNWFEVELLTDLTLTDLGSLRAALRKLHQTYHVPNVVISSIPLSKLSTSIPSYILPPAKSCTGSIHDDSTSYLICVASSVSENNSSEGPLSSVYAGCVELIPGYFTGVGDLFSALLLGHFYPQQSDAFHSCHAKPYPPLALATSHSLSRTHAILALTHESASTLDLPPSDDELDACEPGRRNKRMKGKELRIVEGHDVYRRKEWDGVTRMILWKEFWD